ncbi:hypothetical protein BC629DRAFT_1442332 [Irpex lacteus]|nr:hypothetical protein BC629DRAFT_1442332 [Irpex lacteus]
MSTQVEGDRERYVSSYDDHGLNGAGGTPESKGWVGWWWWAVGRGRASLEPELRSAHTGKRWLTMTKQRNGEGQHDWLAQKNTGPAVEVATVLMLPCEDDEPLGPEGLEAVTGQAAKVEDDIIGQLERAITKFLSCHTNAKLYSKAWKPVARSLVPSIPDSSCASGSQSPQHSAAKDISLAPIVHNGQCQMDTEISITTDGAASNPATSVSGPGFTYTCLQKIVSLNQNGAQLPLPFIYVRWPDVYPGWPVAIWQKSLPWLGRGTPISQQVPSLTAPQSIVSWPSLGYVTIIQTMDAYAQTAYLHFLGGVQQILGLVHCPVAVALKLEELHPQPMEMYWYSEWMNIEPERLDPSLWELYAERTGRDCDARVQGGDTQSRSIINTRELLQGVPKG